MREDLLSLTPESLAILTNVGLVKRAQKELEKGIAAQIEESDDGTVTVVFPDGATTRLPRGTALKSAPCTCGATTVCRHRVFAVLAYRQKLGAAPLENGEKKDAAGSATTWSPGNIADDALVTTCGSKAIALADEAQRASLVVTTKPGAVPVVLLPSATVQFLTRDLAFAKCDCLRGGTCEHVVLAVRAFRCAPEGGLVELGTEARGGGATDVTGTFIEMLRTLTERGFADVGTSRLLSDTRQRAEREGFVWIADAIEDLERQKDAYDRQSAAFRSRTVSELVAEIAARVRASRRAGTLPARWLLGTDQARETTLEHIRLVPLGARLEADGERRMVEIVFADRDSKGVLVLRRRWSFPDGVPAKNGDAIGKLFASSKLSVDGLARGELVTRGAKRRANGLVDLSTARGMKSAILPSNAASWRDLPEGLLVRDLDEHERAVRSLPPLMLRPRKVGDDVRVVAIGSIEDVGWNHAEQELVATVRDEAGRRLVVRTRHRGVAPGAVDAVHRALGGAPRFIAGPLVRSPFGWETVPLAIAGARLVVPDLEKPEPAGAMASAGSPEPPRVLGSILDDLDALTDRGIHKGRAAVVAASASLASRLIESGLKRTAAVVTSIGAGAPDALIDAVLVGVALRQSRLGAFEETSPERAGP